MPEKDERTPGTLDEDKRDAAGTAGDASDSVDAGGSDPDESPDEDEITRLKRINAQLLSEKTTSEQARRENEELKRKLSEREQAGETPAPTADSPQRDLDKMRKELDDDLRAFNEDAASDDPVRKRYGRQMLRQHAVLESQWREAQLQKDLKQVPAELRDDAETLLRTGEAGSIKAAIRLARADRRDRDEGQRDKERDDRNEGKREAREAAPSLGGGGSGAGARERIRPMTKQQVIDRKNALRESGTMDERRKFQSDLDEGRVTVRG